MNEEEAKTKWCHRADRCWGNIHTHEDEVPKGLLCIGSACMAWRWDDVNRQCEIQAVDEKPDWDAPFGPWERYGSVGWISQEPATPLTEGHCGLAGKP